MGISAKYPAIGLMDKVKNTKKKFHLNREIRIDHEMFNSEAFWSLSSTAIRVLLKFYQKRTWSYTGKGRNKKRIYFETKLAFTYAEAGEHDISQSQFHVTIKKLVELGFIDIEHQGGGYGRDYSTYNLSDRWKRFGTPFFKKVEKKRVLQAGYDVRSWQKKKEINPTKNRSRTTTDNRSYPQAAVNLG